MKFLIPIIGTALMMVGCQQQPAIQPAPVVKPKPKVHAAQPPKKNIKLKEVEDENFSSEYMYPETDKKAAKKQEEVTTVATEDRSVSAMTNEECISMIGREKFDKYAQMFGGNAGALKKCKMLKAL
jgi:PBP1b-binding outer membrane lipoprotein LpoB